MKGSSLFWALSTDPKKQAASQAVLMDLYFKLTGTKLKTPLELRESCIDAPDYQEEREMELERMMRQPPWGRGGY